MYTQQDGRGRDSRRVCCGNKCNRASRTKTTGVLCHVTPECARTSRRTVATCAAPRRFLLPFCALSALPERVERPFRDLARGTNNSSNSHAPPNALCAARWPTFARLLLGCSRWSTIPIAGLCHCSSEAAVTDAATQAQERLRPCGFIETRWRR